MPQGWVIVVISFAYLGVLFAIAYWADRRAVQQRSVVTAGVYALSLAVYATTWTFYGSVGRAVDSGVGFLPVYLGPTLIAALWWIVLRKVIRISKAHRITSIADFVSSRYGKSTLLSGLVTVIAVIAIIPYISLQLKAVSSSFALLRAGDVGVQTSSTGPLLTDVALWVALLLAAFAILFGTRHLDASERHEGMVAAIAFESVVKLVAFLAVGVFVTFWMFDGFGDLFRQGSRLPELAELLTVEGAGGDWWSWLWLTGLSALAVMFLPRQFQVAVVENVDERHVDRAVWLFPAYMLAINVFVLPIAFAGVLTVGGAVDTDMYVLALPMAEGAGVLAVLVFIGGLSAATAMVIVETVALSTMVSNDLVMPALVRWQRVRNRARDDLSGMILGIRRVAIVVVLLLGWAYYRIAGEAYALVEIGLVSFAGVAQFAPAFLLGLYWRRSTRRGAVAGLASGFTIWLYALLVPMLARSGWLPMSLLVDGPWGLEVLRPIALLGLEGLDDVTHAMFWSMLANVGACVGVSLVSRQTPAEAGQARLFVDALDQTGDRTRFFRGSVTVGELHGLLARFLGPDRAAELLPHDPDRAAADADAELIDHVERLLGGAIGAASARAAVASVVDEESLGLEEVMSVLDETSQVVAHSRVLERKQAELERTTAELRAANERLQELDRLKDDFVSMVTHELRTPLTSIRSFTEILYDNTDLSDEERQEFLGIVIAESERLTRLINQVLDLSKMEAGTADWRIEEVDLGDVVATALRTTAAVFEQGEVEVVTDVPDPSPSVVADRDRLTQVLLNLLSNAAKFCPSGGRGRVSVAVTRHADHVSVRVSDNGPGIEPADIAQIFEKFRQGRAPDGRPAGTGLGLAISQQIVEHLGGTLRCEARADEGASFVFDLPAAGDADQRPSRAAPSQPAGGRP